MRNIKAFTVLFGLLALISVAYTMPAKKQQQSSVKLQKAMRDLLAELQDEEGDGDLSALLQSEEDEGREQEDNDGDDILALLQDEEGDNGVANAQENDAEAQFFKIIRATIRRRFRRRLRRCLRRFCRIRIYRKFFRVCRRY